MGGPPTGVATGSTLFPFAHWALSSLGVSPCVVSLNAMAKRVVCALLRPREWSSRTGTCPGETKRQGSDDLPHASFRIYFRGSSVADTRLEPPRGVQHEGKILARKPSRPTETAPNRDVGEGLEIDPARKHQVTASLASKAFVYSRDFRGIPRFSCQNLPPSVHFCGTARLLCQGHPPSIASESPMAPLGRGARSQQRALLSLSGKAHAPIRTLMAAQFVFWYVNHSYFGIAAIRYLVSVSSRRRVPSRN